MRQSTQDKRREENVASRTLAEDLFYKFAACAEEDKRAFVDRWNKLQEKAAHPKRLSYD